MTTTDVTGSFDATDPPSRELLDDCVHCGFCLPSCPTFVLWGEEMDSPRGRIYLMRAALEGAPLNAAMVTHFDRCLGCMACTTACPSDVHYGPLINATRGQVERRYRRPIGDRLRRALIFSVFPYPPRLRVVRSLLRRYQRSGAERLVRATGVVRLAPRILRTMESLAPRIGAERAVATRTEAVGDERGVVALLRGCVQDAFFPEVNDATIRVLTAEGFTVLVPDAQGCCGALSAHTGRASEARRFARRVIDVFDRSGVDTVITNSAGCGSAMKEYAELLSGDRAYRARAEAFERKVADVSEFLASVAPRAPRHPLPIRLAYHDACHLGHAQRITEQPRHLLRAIPDAEVAEIANGQLCCGSAGVYNLLEPDAAEELGDRKAATVAATGADLLVAANPGCSMQIARALARAGTTVPTAHTIEVLDASIRGVGAEDLIGRR